MALYTYWGFRTFAAKKKKKARLVRKQKMIMYLFHFLGYAIIYLNEMNTTILGLYGCELLFLIVFGVVYKHLYQRENQPIICHMQMLFSISMVMLGRLNLDSARGSRYKFFSKNSISIHYKHFKIKKVLIHLSRTNIT